MNQITLLLIFFGSFIFNELNASHLIGGYMRYDHLGSGRYRIQLYIYRDCDPFNQGADFDNQISITAYSQSPNGSYRLERDITANLRSKEKSPLPEVPCLELPPRLCVETGYYEIEYQVSGWPRSTSLIFAHQRCCRNGTITNVIAPGDAGVTYFVELTPQAMELGNSSPRFENIPPLATCANAPIDFRNIVNDINNNTLTYEFCSPVVGGGKVGSETNPGNPYSCNGVIPTPACAPPYMDIFFRNPYTPAFPLGGSPTVSIDRNTGTISGTPTNQGQYVGSICVGEWHNGVKIGEIRIEFQINVTQCVSAVQIELENIEKNSNGEFYLKWCDSLLVEINNTTEINQHIEGFKWTIEVNGSDHVFYEDDFSLTFPDYGRYYGSVVVNPGLICTDSIGIVLDVLGSIEADFDYKLDPCNINGVEFENLSSSNNEIILFNWNFGDGNNSLLRESNHVYENSGTYEVQLIVTNSNDCSDSITKDVSYFPIPFDLLIDTIGLEGCHPFEINFNRLNPIISDNYIILWDFGDGSTSGEVIPTHIYQEPGTYSIGVRIENIYGCTREVFLRDNIRVKTSPQASFDYSPKSISRLNPVVNFYNTSVDNTFNFWDFGDGNSSDLIHPLHSYSDTGLINVFLEATHVDGCKDTAKIVLDIVPDITFFMPNAFRPGSGDINAIFNGQGFLEGYKGFDLRIFNRYGQEIFYSADFNTGWNGRLNNEGGLLEKGSYIYKVQIIDPRGNKMKLEGNFLLIN